MDKTLRPEKIFVLFVPWLISLLFSADPVLSYLTAWLGSFFIFYWTLTGRVRAIPADLPVSEQLMRPLFLTQIIFAGYMASTSIFYFLEVLGYTNFTSPPLYFLVDLNQLERVAICQRYYVLAHASFVTGILFFMNYPDRHRYAMKVTSPANFLLLVALVTLPLSTSFLLIPDLRQFYFQFNSLSFIAGTLALAFAIPKAKAGNILISSILYMSNFTQSLLSGFKEPIIISVLVLGIFLYPFYKKLVFITFIPILISLFIILPAYNQVFREQAWTEGENTKLASDAAIDAVLNSEVEDTSTWDFLTGRLSEIQMFTQYVATTPEPNDFYGFTLVRQAITVITPRFFWPNKPSTEDLVMERVFNAGVVARGTKASAKPPFVVDGFLSGGVLGVLVSLFIYGMVAQLISIQAEKLFGGYLFGTALMYSGLFQILWRGLSFEFIANSVFWSFISMLVIYQSLKWLNIIQKVPEEAFDTTS